MEPGVLFTLRRPPRKETGGEHAKLRRLRKAVETGEYRPDPAAIAAALLRVEHQK
jgi:anti-sigma28 factor (negative regulator of flagellin synthesis)